jgi:uncharacterized protein (DUF58 family)
MSTDTQPIRQARMRLKLRLLPILVGVLLVWQLISPSKIWMVLLVGLGGAWLTGYIWSRALYYSLYLHREMRFGWAQVGDHLQERFTLTDRGYMPGLWVEVIDHSSLPGISVDRVSSVGGGSSVQWVTERICEQRGVYNLGPTSVITGDLLGIYQVCIEYPHQAGLMVMPPIVPLPPIEIAPGGRAEEGRRLRHDAMEETVNASGVRDFRPGDALHHIHWPTTARRNELFVRQFESTPSSDWWVFLDLNEEVQAGAGWDSTEEHGVILSASLVDQGLKGGRSVGMVAYGDTLVWQPPQANPSQRLRIMRALTTVHAGPYSLAQLLTRSAPSFTRQASLIIITPDVSGNWLESLLPLVARGIAPTVVLFDPRTFGGEGNTAAISQMLARFKIQNYVFSKEVLDRPEARPGQRGQWEWKVLGTGRAVPLRKPADLEWKDLPG